MKRNRKKVKCNIGKVVLAGGLVATLLAGCSGIKPSIQNAENLPSVTETELPIVKEPLELSLWCQNYASREMKSYDDMEVWKEIQKRTGIDINFQHPVGGATEQFNIMMASGNYPDIVFYDWGASLSKYVQEGIAIPLNDYIDKICPNIKRLMDNDELIARQIKQYDGTIAHFPQINVLNGDAWDGYFLRKDWLDKVGKDVPETIDEWHDVLLAFKQTDLNGNGEHDEVPFSSIKYMSDFAFVSAFGTQSGFYLSPKTKKVTYGPLEPEYKQYIETMRQWYEEGLIDSEWMMIDQKSLDGKFLNNIAGASYMDNNNSMIKYLEMKPSETFDLVAAPFPKGPDGIAYSGMGGSVTVASSGGGIITTTSKHPIEAIKFCDYLYSEEAYEMLNWGIEGKSFTKNADGTKQYTDEILKNPDGKTPYDAIMKYINNHGFMKQYDLDAIRGLDGSLEPNVLQRKRDSEAMAREADTRMALPPLALSLEESKEFTSLESELKSYVEEMRGKFILGVEPIENYDKFVDTVKQLGAERAVEIKQTAYERYINQ